MVCFNLLNGEAPVNIVLYVDCYLAESFNVVQRSVVLMQTVPVYSENKTNSVGEIYCCCWMSKHAVRCYCCHTKG